MSDVSVSSDRPAVGRESKTEPGGLSSTLVLALGTFAVGTDAFVVAGFLPSMADSLHVSAARAGQSVTVFAGAYAVLSPVLATATARLPRRTLLVLALLTLGVANLGSALAPNFAVLIASRVLAAAGAAAYTPCAGAVSAALVRPELRARALAVVVGGLTVATALGVPLGNLASHWLGWRTALGLVAALCLLVAAWLRVIMPALPGNARVPLRTRLAVLRRPAVLAVLPLTVLGMGACYTAYAYSVPALAAVDIPESALLWMLFLYGLGAVIGNLAAGYATDRWGSVRVLTTGYVCMVLALGLLAWLAAADVSLRVAVGLLVLLWGASSWCQTPPQQHRLIEVAPQEAPLVVSLNSSSIYLGIGLGTVLGGLTLPAGMATVYGLGAALAFVALLFLRVTARSAARAD
ncbi:MULTISPECIES: MFS transporter [Streptomyces]|uniref:MFS transporter n=1 Tax=Streptomyces halstedii TaxID=1944 RepID=A0A6N9U0Q2_STRHA|nr:MULTISPECIES: MFS transporter [Streptomyces]AWL42376.1 MFS transporter [Streptomyces sp. SM18]MBV7672931.1 MFS transporter [Streptomyces halstedii]NEA17247.1 MFS transporter [Streptomyces halstedii]UUJ74627.1 Pzm15 [Streptomyces sp.]